MTLVVPELLMPQANQLALIAGESPDDVNTFTQADWQDTSGNLYAVCSTVVKPIVLSLLTTPIADSTLTAEGADAVLAQEAMDKLVVYAGGVLAAVDKIIVGIDIDPDELFGAVGLSAVEMIGV
ncbi:hypothetical protein [Psychrobacter arcticus]|nr:hypothetical protein [Psychrobacter arcticus]